jgi:signal transduction histidine kinase
MTHEKWISNFKSLQELLLQLEGAEIAEEARSSVREALQLAENFNLVYHAEVSALEGQFQDALKSKSQFVSHVTHELRLPLTSIRGYTDLLRQGIVGPVNEQQLNFLDVVKSNVERMTALISDLADINYLDTGRMKISARLIYLDEPIARVVEHLKTRLTEKEQTIVVELPEQTRPAYADEARLQQILTALLNNAWKYTPKGGKITVRASDEGDQVHVSVSDNGIGISPADQEKIFTPFFRSEDEAVREHPGWGLALHLSKRLAEAMDGEMGFESTLHQGSTFWFSLPTQAPIKE